MAGEVKIVAGSAEKCAQHCDELAASLDREAASLQAATNVSGFGGFTSGTDLEAGFSGKVNAAVSAVMSHAKSARAMAENFRAAGKNFENQDLTTAGNVRSVDEVLGLHPDGGNAR